MDYSDLFASGLLLAVTLIVLYFGVGSTKEMLVNWPPDWKDLGLISALVVFGILLGSLFVSVTYNDLYVPWTTEKSIRRAISENDMSYIANNLVNDGKFIVFLHAMDQEDWQRIRHDEVIDALFEVTKTAEYKNRKSHAVEIISAIGGLNEASKLVALLRDPDSPDKAIISALVEIGDLRGICSVTKGRTTEFGDKMYRTGDPWRYMVGDQELIPPTDADINDSSLFNSVACVHPFYEKMFTYASKSLTSAVSGDAVRITWDVYVVDLKTRMITAKARLVGEDPPRQISVNKFDTAFREHGYGIPPVNQYDEWMDLLPATQ